MCQQRHCSGTESRTEWLIFFSPLVSVVTIIMCVIYAIWIRQTAWHINELGKCRMLSHRNLQTVLEHALFNTSVHEYALADKYISSPDNNAYTQNSRKFLSNLQDLIAHEPNGLNFESMYLQTGRTADLLVESINEELQSKAELNDFFFFLFIAVIVLVIATIVTSCHIVRAGRHMMQMRHNLQIALAEQLKKRCNFLAHEVRNTFFPHDLMLQNMLEQHPGTAETVQLIRAGYRTVGDILDRALMIAKYEAGEMVIKPILFNIVSMCKSLEAYVNAAVARNDNQRVEVKYDFLDGEDSQWVLGDRQLCEQAATNLLSNAVKYGGGSLLQLHFSYDGQDFTCTVTDKGKGMSAQDLETACVPFGTIRTGNDQTKGTGLGLPLTHVMIENAGGSLTLQSEGLGHGTVATMRLPLPRSASSSQTIIDIQARCENFPAWANDCKNNPQPLRVLLVDDSKLILKMLAHLCTKLGIDCDTACDGESALDAMMQPNKQYTLVLIDRCMPGMRGDVVCQHARAEGYQGVVVLLTGDQISVPNELIEQSGLSGILSKSQQRESLKNILKYIVT